MVPHLPEDADEASKKSHAQNLALARIALKQVIETLDHKDDLYCLAGLFAAQLTANFDTSTVTSLRLGLPAFEQTSASDF
jgi:hypothetical protein